MAAWRRWAALGILLMPVLLISIDVTVLGFALPALTAELEPSGFQLLWIVDIYSFLLAGLLLLMGNLGDRIGRRLVLLSGGAVFGLASLIAAFASSPELLLAARALLGIGGATLMPSTLSLIRSVFPDARERQTAIAVWAAAYAGGTAIGPVLGGWLVEHFWWGAVFLVNVPIMAILLVGGALALPESRSPDPGPFDPVSALLSIAGMLTLVYGLKMLGGGGSPASGIAATATGGVLLWIFLRRQTTLPEPLLDVGLFRNRKFCLAVTINMITMLVFLPLLFFIPQYFQLLLGMSPFIAGLWMIPESVASIIGSMLAPRLPRHRSVFGPIAAGLLIAAGGLALGTRLTTAGELWLFVPLSLGVGGGIGMVDALTNDVIVASAPPQRTGSAAAVSETAYEFGAAMGTAVFGTLGLAIYRHRLAADLPVALTDTQWDTASQTLAGAQHVAAELTPQAGSALGAVASTAFATGMAWVFGATAAVCLAAAGLALRMHRRFIASRAVGRRDP